MNKVLFAVGLLSAGMAVGQSQTTRTSSTTTSTSNYNTSNTNNENSRNATMGTNSSTDRPMSTTTNPNNRTGSSTGMGTSGMSTGSYSNSSTNGSYNSMGNSGMTTGTYSGSSASGNYNSNSGYGSSTTTPQNSGSYNTNSPYNGSTTTPSATGSYNTNSVGTGTSATTPTATDYNSSANTGSTVTTNSTYSTGTATTRPYRTKDYKNFAYGIYAGLNSTRFRGESIDTENPSGRIGYQAGFFVRGGGRLYGQIGAEYFASSSNYFRPGDGQSAAAIRDQINIQYVQIPVYIGFKLTESDRGISAIRLQVGAEYANRISSSSGQFNLSNSEIKSGSFNALGQLGFDIGPFLIDLTYHHGLSDAVQINTFQGSSRRILSASVGFKF
ncbi:PorT family protein [Fibrella arboris]|uniref:PorT family protein n=1 Tax=Fibrella arboris TaxID=3242486 RepID=UPI0035229302